MGGRERERVSWGLVMTGERDLGVWRDSLWWAKQNWNKQASGTPQWKPGTPQWKPGTHRPNGPRLPQF